MRLYHGSYMACLRNCLGRTSTLLCRSYMTKLTDVQQAGRKEHYFLNGSGQDRYEPSVWSLASSLVPGRMKYHFLNALLGTHTYVEPWTETASEMNISRKSFLSGNVNHVYADSCGYVVRGEGLGLLLPEITV